MTRAEKTTTIEQTSKILKARQAAALVLAVIGGLLFFVSAPRGIDDRGALVGMLLLLAGILGYWYVRARRWWEHG